MIARALVPVALALVTGVAGLSGPVVAGETGGDPQRGEQLYQSRCMGCHSLDADRVGPRHRGVFGRKAGSVEGFPYSRALRESSLVWGEDTLARWLKDPEALIPGQRMNFRVNDSQQIRDIVAFLRRESVQQQESAVAPTPADR